MIGDGALDIANEAEVPAIIYNTFTALGLRRFKIRVNNRRSSTASLTPWAPGAVRDVMRTIDKLEKIGGKG